MPNTWPLTPFEQCMLWDDRPAYPCLCFARLQFQGTVNRMAFETALRLTLAQHPLLNSIVKIGWRPYWCESAEPQLNIVWRSGACGGPLPHAARLDLTQGTGLRVVVVQDGANADVTLQFHHACCDGAAMGRFSEDLFCAYAYELGEGDSAVAPIAVDADLLPSRGSFGLNLLRTVRLLPKQVVGIAGAVQFWGRRPAPIVKHRVRTGDSDPSTHFPASTVFHTTREETIALRKAARGRNVTINELLARDFFLALWDWQKVHNEYDERAWLRMMIPVNMRDASQRSLPAVNYVSSVFLDRRGSDVVDDDHLLQTIHAEMELINKYELRYTFLFFLWLLQWIPGALKRSVRRDACSTSVIFSNAGKISRRSRLPRIDGRIRVADLVLTNLEGLSPVRPYSGIAVFAQEYENRLSFNVHYDVNCFSDVAAEELLQMFVVRLRNSCR